MRRVLFEQGVLTMADARRDDPQLDLTGVEQSLEAGVAGAGAAHAGGLTRLQTMRTAMAAPLQRELARMTAKSGANDPRVAELNQHIDANNELTKKLATEVERASVPAPKADPDAWQVHGHVRYQNRIGVADLTVSLRDEKGAWIQSAGYSCTDKAGYFAPLSLKRDKPASAGTTGPVEATRPVFIDVTDRQKTSLFRDSQPSVASFGTVTYREIILAETPPCVPPETTPTKDGPGKGDPDKGGSGKGDPDKGGSDKGGSDKRGSDKGGSGKGGSDKGGSDKGGSDKGGSDKGGSDKGGSDKGGSGKEDPDKGGPILPRADTP
jgi:hypothetical protein